MAAGWNSGGGAVGVPGWVVQKYQKRLVCGQYTLTHPLQCCRYTGTDFDQSLGDPFLHQPLIHQPVPLS
jgi:hypothetical protein